MYKLQCIDLDIDWYVAMWQVSMVFLLLINLVLDTKSGNYQ